MNALSLFSSIGVGEFFLQKLNINVKVANEVVPSRAKAYAELHPDSQMFNQSILDEEVQEEIVKAACDAKVNLMLATPPCQGVSTVGSNKKPATFMNDERNFLVLPALKIFEQVNPDYLLIENVPSFEKMLFPHEGKLVSLYDLLKLRYADDYNVAVDVLDASDYGVPQVRKRVVYRVWRHGKTWSLPEKQERMTLKEAIGDLPSLKPGESSSLKNHFARKHPDNQILAMSHTAPGHSAFENEVYYPKKNDGTKVKGYMNTYKRMLWDAPSPTVTMRNEIISSQQNVHPGRKMADGLWSDPRVLTLRELLIVSSMPAEVDIPSNLSENQFRQLIGEGVPPRLMTAILQGILE